VKLVLEACESLVRLLGDDNGSVFSNVPPSLEALFQPLSIGLARRKLGLLLRG
jgi:hypothetical protein